MQEKQTELSGGVSCAVSSRTHAHDPQHLTSWLMISTKALVRHPEAMALLKQIWINLRFEEKDRILELMQQRYTRWKTRIVNAGHNQAMLAANRAHSKLAAIDYATRGLPALQALGLLELRPLLPLHSADGGRLGGDGRRARLGNARRGGAHGALRGQVRPRDPRGETDLEDRLQGAGRGRTAQSEQRERRALG